MKILVLLAVTTVVHSEDVLDVSPSYKPVITSEGFIVDSPKIAATKIPNYWGASVAFPDHTFQEYVNTFRSTPAKYYIPALPSVFSERSVTFDAPAPIQRTYFYLPIPLKTVYNVPGATISYSDSDALRNAVLPIHVYGPPSDHSYQEYIDTLNSTPAYSEYRSPPVQVAPTMNDVVDMPEVASAKAAHIAAHAKALAASGIPAYTQQEYIDNLRSITSKNVHGSSLTPTENIVVDTPEVASAKAAHVAAHAKALAASGIPAYAQQEYIDNVRSITSENVHGSSVATTENIVVDTPEVASAKAAHIAAHAKTLAASGIPAYAQQDNIDNLRSITSKNVHGSSLTPTENIVVDTPEVASAKAAHIAAYAKALAASGIPTYAQQDNIDNLRSITSKSVHGSALTPTENIVVDTPEVASAKAAHIAAYAKALAASGIPTYAQQDNIDNLRSITSENVHG